jgi:glycosyltransferase involved in cell wall biosynthesis
MNPEISVVVPTRRRPELLERCLAALARQTVPPSRYAIIVVDDASDSGTRGIVQQMAVSLDRAIRYFPVRGTHGPAKARNLGWRNAPSDVVVFTDDDCVPEPDWLAARKRQWCAYETSGIAAHWQNAGPSGDR